MNFKGLIDSFNYAISGFIYAVRTQRNMKIHMVAAIGVIIFSLFTDITKPELLVLCIAITMVMSAELFNTAIESAIDATTNHYHPLAKIAKNTAAAAVLLTTINAVIVGYFIFWNEITTFTYRGVQLVKHASPYLVLVVLVIVSLSVILTKAVVGEGTPLKGGMPSGHAAVAFSLATIISYLSDSTIAITLSYLMAIIVAQSRVDSKVHSVKEVFVGGLLGFLITILVFRIFGF
ncbi:diacylglycerol kinase [Proteiniclasticum sp. BAD-10]|jgi:diacylglycerol kinase (ATP)|uniref:Diacylglycerol kinase n=1 Tax=Proteiniclasticum sediminis TaxID=2804028 RepID=A0A941HRI1_9CLOT|nr:diacylglycerol kinase [Proteiniclasticum sediminis]MBR0576628.1 diacylglycerol kinase [Proteiniclasticum sediminis]